MVAKRMVKTKKIDKAAKDFFNAVIAGMKNRPAEFVNDKDMAKAAGVPVGTFNEYKHESKGTQRPNFFTIFKIAYLLAKGPPCSLAPETLIINRFQEALALDQLKILDKIISLIVAGSDLEPLAASIDIHYRRLISPQKISQNS